jgi:glyceraldehyde 3-phosphate dehydrogenase
MVTTVAINGFGRIGRNVLRALYETGRSDIKIVALNDLATVEANAHLLKYDSVHGRFPFEVTTSEAGLHINGDTIAVSAHRDPSALDWEGVDVVLECTGIFTSKEKAMVHIAAGAKRVLVSAPSEGADKTIVYGVNHSEITAQDILVSNASCTTNCLSPVAKVIDDTFGIKRGFMTTVHSYTGDQPTLDRNHSDLYRARAAAMSMIPTSTGAARAVGLVLPQLKGKLDGVAIRVPTPNVSAVDVTFELNTQTTVEHVNEALSSAARCALQGVLDVTSDKLVSIDLNHDPHSSIVALDQTKVLDGQMVRILAWYDNEWGFSNRMLDNAALMGAL